MELTYLEKLFWRFNDNPTSANIKALIDEAIEMYAIAKATEAVK